MIIYGLNPVREALRAGRVRELRIAGTSSRVADLERLASRAGVPVRRVPAAALARTTSGGSHQGVTAEVDTPPDLTLEALLGQAGSPMLLVVLDGIEDPQNVGAILRVVDAAGVDGVVRQTRRAASLGSVARSSAGALAHVRLASVVNLARALDELKDAGVWTVGLEADGAPLYEGVGSCWSGACDC